jgi:hypothetical protein
VLPVSAIAAGHRQRLDRRRMRLSASLAMRTRHQAQRWSLAMRIEAKPL